MNNLSKNNLFKHGDVTIIKSRIEAIEIKDEECPGSKLRKSEVRISLFSGASFLLPCKDVEEAILIKEDLEKDLETLSS